MLESEIYFHFNIMTLVEFSFLNTSRRITTIIVQLFTKIVEGAYLFHNEKSYFHITFLFGFYC